jgi:SNF2 family DNA or RNA helicase
VLRARFDVVAEDDAVDLPVALPPRLELVVQAVEDHRAEVSWQWAYSCGGAVRRIGVDVSPVADRARDPKAERAALTAVKRVLDALPQPVPALTATEGHGVARLAPSCTLEGMQTVLLFTEVIPALRTGDLADIQLRSTAPDYRFTEAEPVITFRGVADGAAGEVDPASADLPGRDRDWFDLAITVEVDGRNVPFGRLFTALARQQKHLILDDGTVVRLGNDRFGPLLSLISESRAISDSPPGTIRASRYQASLLADLDDVGEFDGPAAAWRDAARALIEAPVAARREPPAGLLATLRPYQLEGFHWLATLYDIGLGGILADDMGLGKTLQALALILHARNGSDENEKPTYDPQQTERASGAFLVVAPTSVMGTWVGEAERFAPGLRVVQIGETARRRRRELAELVRGADIVVTSYTLFRLEDADYAALSWAGVVLDEAQFAKNHRSVVHQKLRSLPAPFKLAITGTPMENSLMELWAILAITAPGLFPSASRFVDHYRTPIEKGRNQERLDQLRRRVRPLMLRRTKETVAADLPEKQEQVLMLELNPEHRREYQKHLHRERLKVLKLLTDLDQHRLEVLRSLTLLRQASLDIGLIDRLVVDEERRPAPSTKLDAMMEMLEDIVAEGHRTLIFSQFTRFLTKAAARLDEAGIEYCYLDGRTKRRAEVIERFRTGSAPVFLISLKAGGFGLTLTEADYCVLLDPWWNPAAEAQAVDRVHRIGQTRNVNVYRMVAKDTIEEKVMALQAAKRELFGSVMDGGAFASGALDADDIRSLLE